MIDVNFDLNKDFVNGDAQIPDFVLADFINDGARMVILGSWTMCRLMKDGDYLFCDGTYKLIRKPFLQLWSIHVFTGGVGNIKQVPVCFILMSRKRKSDYVAVLQEISSILTRLFPTEGAGFVNLERIVLDFEAAAWQAVRSYLPDVELKGCNFHYTQSIYKRIKMLGLEGSYRNHAGTYRLCRSLMALAMLPEFTIVVAFEALVVNVQDDTLKKLVAYVRKVWIESRLFPPRSWNWYNEGIRTNNDTEGWHNKLNSGSSKLPTYRLFSALGHHARLVEDQQSCFKGYRKYNLAIQS